MDLQSIGKLLVLTAVALGLLGGLVWLAGSLGFGNLPGTLRIQRGGWSCVIPVLGSIVLSILLTLLLNFLVRFWNR